MNGNSAKGRKLPPLLPVEYCRLDRAARMLECEVEDLLHWGATGAVKLLFWADNLRSETVLNYRDITSILSTCTESEIDSFFTQEFIWKPSAKCAVSINFKEGYSEIGSLITTFENMFPDIDPFGNKWLYAALKLSGFFCLDLYSLEDLYLLRHCSTIGLLVDQPAFESRIFFVRETLSAERIFIAQGELGRIYQAVTTGTLLKAEVKTVNTKIHHSDAIQRISDAKAAAERNSAPRAELVLSLLELVLGEESSLIDNPYALYQRVNKQLREANIIEPEITEQAFADILSKAKSARKDRLKNPS